MTVVWFVNSPERIAALSKGMIRVRGARVHNLQGIDLDIPHDSLVVITGVSGSGKSSLAFDTIFAEAQRRYLESLSTYTRQFLNQLERADVDSIDGLPPAISVDQRSRAVRHRHRSTLATMTEIYDYLRLLYARAGTVHCTECGQVVSQQSPQQIVDQILRFEERQKLVLLAPVVVGRRGKHRDVFERICKDGFVRARVDGEIADAADPPDLAQSKNHTIEAVVDRIILKEGIRPRLHESIELALKHGNGSCIVSRQRQDGWHDQLFSSRLACPRCEISFPELEPRTFSFNSPYGACPRCSGIGLLESESSPADHAELCPDCDGARLAPMPRSVTFAEIPIHKQTAMSVGEALDWVQQQAATAQSAPDTEAGLAVGSTLPEIESRLRYLCEVGLDYLSLARPADTLSGGEFQRARLASCLGSGLIGACYVLDEPTIGLHSRDTDRMIQILKRLRDQGNSVLLVEHDIDMMRHADCIVDLGPGAGRLGGHVVAVGHAEEIAKCPESITARFLSNGNSQTTRTPRKVDWSKSLSLTGACLHNLKQISVRIPLGVFVAVTGVSGSGKTSLITQTMVPAIRDRIAGNSASRVLEQSHGDEHVERLIEIDQSPIGRTGRSNPATYSGVWDEIRKVFSKTRESRIRGYKANRFSFNAKSGRCDECSGQGTKRIEMNFLPDLYVECSACRGARFNRQTLSIRYRGHSVADVLQMPIVEAVEFFDSFPRISRTLKMFDDVGLGYLRLGQSSKTLSGGEAQRVKLASELCRKNTEHTLFVLDEPTTGLHPADIERLIQVLHQLVESDNSVIIIEHQLDTITAADWIIDLGPEGGADGGQVVAEGTPADLAANQQTHTSEAIRRFLGQS